MAKKKTASDQFRWDGPPSFIPGWGRLEPGKTYAKDELPDGAENHPRLTPVKEEEHE